MNSDMVTDANKLQKKDNIITWTKANMQEMTYFVSGKIQAIGEQCGCLSVYTAKRSTSPLKSAGGILPAKRSHFLQQPERPATSATQQRCLLVLKGSRV